MYVRVFLHVAFLVEAFPTVLARVGPSVTVYQQVGGEGGRPLECFPTLFTRERAFLRMHGSVLIQANRMAKCLFAHVTGVRPGTSMAASDVHLQPVRSGKRFVTHCTVIGAIAAV